MRRNQATMIAFCGMAAALSLVIMLIGGIIPAATYAVPLLCGLINLWVAVEFGRKPAWTTYAAVAILSLLIDFDKEAAFFYIFFGYYPIIKWRIDRMKGKLLMKIGIFTVSLVLMYLLLSLLFPLTAAMEEFKEMGMWLTIGFGVVTIISMLVYDRLLEVLIPLYANRIQPKLKWLHRS